MCADAKSHQKHRKIEQRQTRRPENVTKTLKSPGRLFSPFSCSVRERADRGGSGASELTRIGHKEL